MTEQPSIDGTRLARDTYLAHLDADLESLLAAVEDLGAAVPGCPGWTVRDLLGHLTGVYRHKAAAMRTDAQPVQPDTGDWGDLGADEDAVAALRSAYSELVALLETRDPDETTWTWWPTEQTVAFWQRRMAQETTVHRWDAESALDGPDGAGDVPDDLAADGVDELLGWLRWPWDEVPQDDASGQQVLVATEDHAWVVTLDRTAVSVRGGSDGAEGAVAMVAGPASGLLLHLWGRPGEHGIATSGDETALRLLRERLAMATS